MLARDANALHEELGGDGDAVIIGHDWGAPTVYGAAIDAPSRWKKVVGMAVPPTAALGLAFVQNLEQIKRSWYMFFFQHGLADLVVGANNHAYIEMLWRDWSPGYDASFDLDGVKKSLADPKNLQAALGRAGVNASVTFVGSSRYDVERRNLPPLLRLSVHCTTTITELERAVEVLEQATEVSTPR